MVPELYYFNPIINCYEKTDLDKEKYLNRILSIKGLLTPETYKVVQKLTTDMYGNALDKMYGEKAMKATEKRMFTDAEKYAKKIKRKELTKEIYEQMAKVAKEEGRFGLAGELAEKAGNKEFAENLRKRLEAKSKKK